MSANYESVFTHREKKMWRKAAALHVPDMVEKSYRVGYQQKVLQEEWWHKVEKDEKQEK